VKNPMWSDQCGVLQTEMILLLLVFQLSVISKKLPWTVVSCLPRFSLCIDKTETSQNSTDNLFNFCHLGVEIFLKSNPAPCQVFGNHFPLPYPGTVAVHVKSDFSEGRIKVMGQRNEGATFKKILLVVQDIPFIGRLAAHSPVCYWVRS
jgi:hypothetical protein